MSTHWRQLALTGSLTLLAGCIMLPNSANLGTAQGTLNVGLAGNGYTVLSLVTQASSGSESLTFNKVYFKPTKIEVHYAGPMTDSEKQADPVDIKGQSTDQSSANPDEETSIANDGQWIEFPVENGAIIDLTQLGTGVVSFGEDPLKVGKYDQIRLTGSGSYEAMDASESLTTDEYKLPSGRLYINQGFEVREGYKTDLKFAFDANTAMVVNPERVILKPTSVKVFATYTQVASEITPSPEGTSSL